LPAGFCAGIHPAALASLTSPTERAHFAWHGQRVFERLSRLPFTTLAFIDGLCLGAGLELALACDHRLCVARPTTHLGVQPGVPPCFGGSDRMKRLTNRTLSGREAKRLGLVDHAFCERRAKIELRSFLDDLERRDVSPPRLRGQVFLPGWVPCPRLCVGMLSLLQTHAHAKPWAWHPCSSLAAERRAFAQAHFPAPPQPLVIKPTLNPIPPLPAVLGMIGENEDASRIIADAVLRGASAVISGSPGDVKRWIAISQARGFITPLEMEQALARIHHGDVERAGLVFVANGQRPLSVGTRAIVAVCDAKPVSPFPGRSIGVRLTDTSAELIRFPHTDSDTVAALAAWLKAFGFTCTLAARSAHSARLAA
jgi:enoyl-CoA hydratase/carnithine racemase